MLQIAKLAFPAAFILGAIFIPPVHADAPVFNDSPKGASASPPWQLATHSFGENTERQLPPVSVILSYHTCTSTRRFLRFPAAVLFDAIGWESPTPS